VGWVLIGKVLFMRMVTVVKTAETVAVNELPYLGSLKQMQLQ